MIRILISAQAYAVLADSMDGLAKPQRCPEGGVFIWLDKVTVSQLAALRGPAESYSDAILRLAELEAAP